jgi:hypothetical protein
MRDLAVLVLHLLTTFARLAGPGGARAVVAESVLVKQQLLILNRSRRRSPNLRLADRVIAGVCTLLMRPSRLARAAIVLKPRTRSCACGSQKTVRTSSAPLAVLGSIGKGHARRAPDRISNVERLSRRSSRRAPPASRQASRRQLTRPHDRSGDASRRPPARR